MDQKILKAATILAAVGLLGFLVFQKIQASSEKANQPSEVSERVVDPDAAAKRAALRETVLGSYGQPLQETTSSKEESNEPEEELQLRTGVIGATPGREQITTIEKFPYSKTDVRKAYANSRDRACRLLIPGVPVSPPLTRPITGQAGSLGRVTVMTIGLEFDENGPKKLPAITRGQVKKYFAAHRLAVQPILYCDANNRPYFGTDCETAFYELYRPGTTARPEPMIETAVSRFRALGIVGNGSNKASDVLGRTLALAFTFAKKDETLTSASDKFMLVTEVMLLHLTPDCTGDDPEVNVFVTSDERTNLHRLETRGMRLNSPTPLVSSDIQFNKTMLMGMYPADPVVSGIRYRSAGILSMETVKRMGRPDGDRPGISLTEILDQFGKLASLDQ